MTAADIIKKLKPLGAESYKKVLLNHGATEPVFGVKIEELKKIHKVVKQDYQLALDLYDTGIYDAMYLAGLIADDKKMSKKDLTHWVKTSPSHGISEYTVAWVAAESLHGREMAMEWIESKKDSIASAGWATLSGLVSITDDADLDIAQLKALLARVQKTIASQPNRTRYAMNGFVIAVGSYVSSLTATALKTGAAIGTVTVDVGGTACKVPFAPDHIAKIQKRGAIGKKRKTTKC